MGDARTDGSDGAPARPLKVRVGIGAPAATDPDALAALAGDLADTGFDSLWCAEVLTAPGADPLVALAWAAAAAPKLKLGTILLLPGRNPVRLAKQLATLDRLSGGRLLVTFVPGVERGPERGAIGVAGPDRARAMDEALPLLHELLAGRPVTHHGILGQFDDVTLPLLPVQGPFDFWTGGMARAALLRCGRLADGWLPSLCTPAEAAAAKVVIDEAAAEAGRAISPEHFGVGLSYSDVPMDGAAAATLSARSRGHDPADLVPVGLDALRRRIEEFVAVGVSKFVVRPLVPPPSWRAELERLATAIGNLQT